MNKLISILLFLPILACSAAPSKSELDAEVKRLCAIDGGIKVYETVKLPKEKFDKWGNVRIPPKEKLKPEDEYYYESETVYLKEGDPTFIRMHTRVVRRSDGKVMGESIRYGRGGGDLPGPWHPSSFTCPSPNEKPYLEPSVFLKGSSNE